MTDLLTVHDIHTYYGSSYVLQGCSLSVGDGCTCVLGRNGMGKTTLMRSIMGLTPPRSGSILFDGADITGARPEMIARRGIGYVPQGRRLFPSLSVHEHLVLFHRRSGTSTAQWTPERLYELFPELAGRRKVSGTRLSGGEQQMLTMARALVTNPSLLILDEPSEGLSPVAVDRVVDACRNLIETGMRLLLVEQNITVARRLADSICVLVSGRSVHNADASVFFEDTALRQELLGV
ncbi:MAG: ABC transporter ATP-binding protein [Propionicimonas sp.]|uniref:ABC transporter ATP-binding protein n=1 Tax=Propionicimonas sp. TaxID=1955623 RepID=UPI002B21C431|nr:ABC transporter ATP-binding protein [Propionicimonas sp.]MEA4944879.1 ABC transporter ATP-binding protein [Propionicimonas sp.]MEA5053097.1 ABC transporter ATP-binding protein [Propionicimonas sp.]MEA5116751.1 ABC transporter ATP-binding protein [Propionicimonas sp.]